MPLQLMIMRQLLRPCYSRELFHQRSASSPVLTATPVPTTGASPSVPSTPSPSPGLTATPAPTTGASPSVPSTPALSPGLTPAAYKWNSITQHIITGLPCSIANLRHSRILNQPRLSSSDWLKLSWHSSSPSTTDCIWSVCGPGIRL